MNETTTWIDRLRTEYSELKHKLGKLENYLETTPVDEQVGRELLMVQASIMEAYKTVLEARVLAANKEGKL
mgnify:FL=1